MTMKWILIASLLPAFLFTGAHASSEKTANTGGLNTQQIETLTGAKGQFDQKEQVFKVSVPRSDLKVTINGVKFVPAMGLTSWVAFKMAGGHAMVMGDLVLTQNQVNSAMSSALDNGLNVTALHNHFLWENPRIMFMHIEGMDSIDKLAQKVGKVFAAIKATSNDNDEAPSANLDPSMTSLTSSKLDAIIGKNGSLKDGVYKVSIGRTAKMDDFSIGNAMGVNTWAAFVGTDEQAVVDGDFAMHESELQKVLAALRHAGIYIVAIHQHMTGEQPRFMFLHYYGVGKAEALAKGLRAALDVTKEAHGAE